MLNLSEKDITEKWDISNPLVSIKCTTFNQEQYIAQCLDGFLIQKTNFPFEIIVHDDASTDQTSKIIREYELRYPNIIKPIYEVENQYSKHDGSLSRIIDKQLNGKYLAFCEGDDYWCDPQKLQTQYDFMKSHGEYSAVGHLTKSVDARGNETKTFIDSKPGDYLNGDQEKWQLFSHYSSIFCINYTKLLSEEEYENYIATKCPGDRKISVMLMSLGKLHVLPFVGSVYRFRSNPNSFTSIADNFRISYLWEQGFNLSQYAKSVGFQFAYTKRQKMLVAYALKEYIKGTDKKTYVGIRRIEPSNAVRDFLSSIPVYIMLIIRKIRKHEQ